MTHNTSYAEKCGAACVDIARQFLDEGDEASARVIVKEGLTSCADASSNTYKILNDLDALLRLTERLGDDGEMVVFGHRIRLMIEPAEESTAPQEFQN